MIKAALFDLDGVVVDSEASTQSFGAASFISTILRRKDWSRGLKE